MIQQLTKVLAKVLFHVERKEYDVAQQEIDTAGELFIGVKWSFLRTLADEHLILLLGYEQNPDKMLAAAELLREESDLLHAQGKLDESITQGMKSFSLFVELIIREKGYLTIVSTEKIDALLARLSEYEMPVHIQQKQFRYYEATERYAKAEDVLFDVIERDDQFVAEGVKFFNRLLAKSDEELEHGGLTRSEVMEGLAELQSI